MIQRHSVLVLLLACAGLAWSQPSYPDFSSVAGLNLMGVAAQSGNVLRLTPSTAEVYGGAWYNTKQHIKDGFTTRFQFVIWDTATITDGAGNGMAFIIQNDNANVSVSPRASYYEVGDANVKTGFCLEFRTSEKEGAYGTIPPNQLSMHTNGPNGSNSELGYPTYSIASAIALTSIKDADTHTVYINYVPGTMKVYLDDMTTPLMNVNVDLTNVVGGSVLDNNGDAWMGLTAGTCGTSGNQGTCYETHDILNWSSLVVKLHDDTICAKSVIRLTPSVTGGALPLTFQWTPSTGLDSPTVASPLASPLTTTKYLLTVTDVNGTTAKDSMTLTVHPKPTVKTLAGFTMCQGTSGTLSGIPATGGTPPYSYSWTPPAGVANASQLTTSASPNATTTFHLTVTDAFGCTDADSVVVFVNPWPQLSPGDNLSLTICEGDTVTIGGPAVSGAGPFTYQWSPAIGLSATNLATVVAKPTTSITYTVVVTDSKGCQNHGQVVFFVNPIPHPRIIAADSILCDGDTTTLTSTDSNFKAYRWSTGDTTRSIRVWKAGSYTVTATGPSGCRGTSPRDSITVLPRPAVPVITANGATKLCEGDAVLLSVPAGNYSLLWSSGETTPSITVKKSGVYFVSARGPNGCTSKSLPITVSMNPKPKPVIVGPTVTCVHSTATYSVDDSATYTYVWTVSAGGTITSGAGTNTITVQWNGAGTEQLDVTETIPSTGCFGSSSEAITISSSLKPRIGIRGDTVLCTGDSVILDAGAGYSTYQWSSGETSQKITVKQAGVFVVHVSSSGGCSGQSDSLHVTIASSVSFTVAGPDTVCANSTVTYHVPPVAGRTYTWTVTGGNPLTATTGDSIVVQWGGVGNGKIDVLAQSGSCTGTVTLNVSVSNNLLPHVTASGPTTFCIGDSVMLTADAGFTNYQWSDGESTRSITVSASGTFTVTVHDASGCSGTSAPVVVTVGSSLVPVITGATAFCPGDSTTLDAGVGYTTYRWSTGESTESIVVKTPGTYNVAVARGNCSGTSQDVIVTVYPAPVATITVNGNTLSTTAFASYQWNFNGTPIPGATAMTYVATQTGDYTVTVTDANGCTGVSAPVTQTMSAPTATVEVGAIPPASPGSSFEIPINLVGSQGLLASNASHYVGSLRYNGTMLIPTGSRGGVLGGSQAIPGSTDRTVAFEGHSAPLTAGTLQWIQCEALLGNDTCTTVTIDTIYWTDASVVVTRQGMTFCESGICLAGGTPRRIDPVGMLMLNPGHPNPASDAIVFEYSTVEAGETQLELIDAIGRTVRVIRSNAQIAGAYTATIPVNNLQSGCYVCVLRTPSQVLRQLFLVRK